MKNKTKKIRVWDIFKSAFETEMRRKEKLPTDVNYTITEKRADEYAASIIGLENAIKSLESFIKITTPGVINRRVINERIDYLQQKIKK